MDTKEGTSWGVEDFSQRNQQVGLFMVSENAIFEIGKKKIKKIKRCWGGEEEKSASSYGCLWCLEEVKDMNLVPWGEWKTFGTYRIWSTASKRL